MPTEPTDVPAVPTDALSFDAWARAELDAWRLPRVRQVAEAVWDDPASPPAWKAVAGIWLGGEDGPVASESLLALADGPELPPFFAARLRAVAAAEIRPDDVPRAKALAERAVAEVRDPSVDQRTRLAVLRTAAEVALRSGRLGDAVAILDESRLVLGEDATRPGRETLIVAAIQLDVIGAALAHQRQQPSGDAAAAQQVAALAQACLAQARATATLALAAEDVPAVISIRIGVGRVLADLGLAAEADPLLASVDRATIGNTEALALRFQALLALADVRLATAGPEAALAVQRQAADSVRHLGATPMLAWADRGVALQLQAAGRHDEAQAAFTSAIDQLHGAGQVTDALALGVEQARGLAEAGRPEEATSVLATVLAQVAELDDEARLAVEPGARDLAARLAATLLDHEASVTHWLHLVDLAPKVGISVADPRSAAALELARGGDAAEAEALFDQAEVDAADGPAPEYHLALVMGRRARVRRSDDRHDEAAELLRIAVNHARVAEDPALVGRLSLQLAEAQVADGHPAAAVDALLDARAEAAGVGLADLVATLDARLAELGHG